MPIVGKATGFDYTGKWGIDVGSGQPIQMGSRPPSEADWEQMTPQEKAAFGLPDWDSYQKFQHAYEGRSAPGGDIYQEKARAAEILLRGHPSTWEQAKNLLLQNGYDPSSTASGPLFKELEAMWNGGSFAAGGHGSQVQSPGGGLDALAAWLPGLGQGLAMQDWMRKGTSSMEGYDQASGTYWNRRPDGSLEFFSITGQPLSGNQIPRSAVAAAQNGGGGGGLSSMGGYGMGGGDGFENELAQQAHLDTLGQQFQYEKAAREYGEALPIENYMKNLYGDIMGVDFETPQFSLNNYFQQGMQGAGHDGQRYIPGFGWDQNQPAYTGGVPGDNPGSPQNPDNRVRLPADDPALQAPAGRSDVARLSAMSAGPGQVTSQYVGDREGPYNSPQNTTPRTDENGKPIPGGNSPVEHSPISPGSLDQIQQILNGYNTNLGGGGGGGYAAPLPSVPFPTLEGQGYHLKTGPAADLANRSTFGLLAPEVNRRVEDYDRVMKRFHDENPVGGESSAASADLSRQLGGDIYSIRQNLMGQAMNGLSSMAATKKGYSPAGYSGGGQALLSSSDTERGQDLQNSQFGQNLAFQRESLAKQLEAQRNSSKSNLFGSLLGSIGGLLGNTKFITGLSDERAKDNITPHERGLTDLAKVNTYEWDYLPEFGGTHSFGVIAQELEKIMPEAVGMVDGLKVVNYPALLATTINAIQELEERVEKAEKIAARKKRK